jgi:hypothetical protein
MSRSRSKSLRTLSSEGRCTLSMAARVRRASSTVPSCCSSSNNCATWALRLRPSRPRIRAWLAASRPATEDSQRHAIVVGWPVAIRNQVLERSKAAMYSSRTPVPGKQILRKGPIPLPICRFPAALSYRGAATLRCCGSSQLMSPGFVSDSCHISDGRANPLPRSSWGHGTEGWHRTATRHRDDPESPSHTVDTSSDSARGRVDEVSETLQCVSDLIDELLELLVRWG